MRSLVSPIYRITMPGMNLSAGLRGEEDSFDKNHPVLNFNENVSFSNRMNQVDCTLKRVRAVSVR